MRDDELVKKEVGSFFENAGWTVSDVLASEVETPDLLITLESERTLVEIKSKFPSKKTSQQSIFVEQIERKTKYSKASHKASGQLQNSEGNEVDFRVMWLDCGKVDQDLNFHNYRYSLFGIRLCQPLGSRDCREGYYITHSDFFSYCGKIDGAFISCKGDVSFLINNYSPNYEKIRASPISSVAGTPIDAIELETRGEIYLADFDTDRNNEEEMQKALSRKYGFQAMFLMSPSGMGVRM